MGTVVYAGGGGLPSLPLLEARIFCWWRGLNADGCAARERGMAAAGYESKEWASQSCWAALWPEVMPAPAPPPPPGVDYEVILRQAEKEADVVLWDGERACCASAPSSLHGAVQQGGTCSWPVGAYRPGRLAWLRALGCFESNCQSLQAATTTRPSSSPTCLSASPTRTGWATSSASTPATCASGKKAQGAAHRSCIGAARCAPWQSSVDPRTGLHSTDLF